MSQLFSFVQRKSTLMLSLLIVILCLIVFAVIQGDALRGKTGLFTMQTAHTVEELQTILAEWGERGVRVYLQLMYADFIFPLAYGLLLSSAIARLTVHDVDENGGNSLFLLPLVAGGMDWIENIFHIFMLQNPDHLEPLPTLLAAVAASAKWALLGISLAVVLVNVLKRLLQKKADSQ